MFCLEAPNTFSVCVMLTVMLTSVMLPCLCCLKRVHFSNCVIGVLLRVTGKGWNTIQNISNLNIFSNTCQCCKWLKKKTGHQNGASHTTRLSSDFQQNNISQKQMKSMCVLKSALYPGQNLLAGSDNLSKCHVVYSSIKLFCIKKRYACMHKKSHVACNVNPGAWFYTWIINTLEFFV